MAGDKVRELFAGEAKARQQAGKSADGAAGGRGKKKTLVPNGTKVSDPNENRATAQAAKAAAVSRACGENAPAPVR